MKILILGGTRFLGRALVDAVKDRGHTLILFNRGMTNPDLYPHIEKLVGDRDGQLDALRGHSWDAVIDTCGYVPRIVKQSLDVLKGKVGFYVFISSVSVYADHSQPMDESCALARMEDETVEEITGSTYGPLKVLCEKVVETSCPGRTLIIRPGYIVGPHDPSDRFTWWPHRVALGGEMLCPGKPEREIQVIDVGDLADWTVRMVEEQVSGAFNAVGPPISMDNLLSKCLQTSGMDTRFTWVSEALIKQNITDLWSSFPIWVPESEPAYGGMHAVSAAKALAHGLTCRAIEHTVRATFEWDKARPGDYEWRTGLPQEEENMLLQKWHAR